MGLCESLLIGILSSFVASVVWWLLFQLIDFTAKQKLNYYYARLRDKDMLFQKLLDYNDYDLAINLVDQIVFELESIISAIKPITYLCRKKKFVYTLINNLYFYYTVFLREYKWYDK